MSINRDKFRELVFQLLYGEEVGGRDQAATFKLLMQQLKVTRRDVILAAERVEAIKKEMPHIDRRITEVSAGYDFERIKSVEKNILRLAAYELFSDPSIPPKVAIAEAVRLCRKFSTTEASKFVNAILHALYTEDQGEVKKMGEELARSEQLAEEVGPDLVDREENADDSGRGAT